MKIYPRCWLIYQLGKPEETDVYKLRLSQFLWMEFLYSTYPYFISEGQGRPGTQCGKKPHLSFSFTKSLARNMLHWILTNFLNKDTKLFLTLLKHLLKNPAHGRHQLSRPMRKVEAIQIWRGCVIYLFF